MGVARSSLVAMEEVWDKGERAASSRGGGGGWRKGLLVFVCS